MTQGIEGVQSPPVRRDRPAELTRALHGQLSLTANQPRFMQNSPTLALEVNRWA
jgi:hypothetical protein